jgi:hypothetical protein
MNDQMLKEHEVCNKEHEICSIVSFKCMSWTGIIAGALIAVGLSFLFSLFGAGIGLAAFHTTPEGATTMAIGGYIGMVIGTIAIMYLAGWVAGYCGRTSCCSSQCIGAVYGITAWCLALVVMVILATQTTQFISGNLYSITNHQITNDQLFNNVKLPMITESIYSTPNNDTLQKVSVNINVIDDADRKLLSMSLLLTFALFFIGAISSALGGYCGIKSCCDKDCDCGCNCCSTGNCSSKS